MNKVKWGVIGAGGIADRRTMPGMMLANNAELTAVMEVSMDLANKYKEKYNAQYAYDNMEELLGNDEIQAIYIASPVPHHYEQVKKAAEAGKHILVEKPMAASATQGEELVALCKKKNVKLAVGLMMRYGSYHQKMKALIAEGKLGQVVSARAQLTCWFPDMEGNWRQDPKQSGGGALMDMGIHCLDILEYIIGSNITKVSGFVGTKTFKYKADDSSAVIFEMANGCAGFVDNNFNIPDAAAQCRLEIYGTRGSILAKQTIGQIDGGEVEVCLSEDSLGYDAKQDRGDVNIAKMEATLGNMYTREIESFSNSIINDSAVEVSGEIGVHIQKVCEAAYKAAEKGCFQTV